MTAQEEKEGGRVRRGRMSGEGGGGGGGGEFIEGKG